MPASPSPRSSGPRQTPARERGFPASLTPLGNLVSGPPARHPRPGKDFSTPRTLRPSPRASRSLPWTLAALLLVLAGCEAREAASDPETQAGEEAPRIPVAVQVLSTGRSEALIRAWGTVTPDREAVILAEVAGTVHRVAVALGDRVEEGQVLLEIDPSLHRARVREAETALESARIGREKAEKDLERSRAMFERGTVSDSELETARTRFAETEAAHAAAAASLEEAKKNLRGAILTAPFDARVAARPPDPGSTVNPGAPLLTLVDIDRVRIEARVSEQDLPDIRPGDVAALTVQGAPGTVFTGTVAAVGPDADPDSRQYPVEIRVEIPPGLPLRGGMVARVEIVTAVYEDLPLLPVDALLEEEGEPVFYVVEGGTAVRRRAVIGPRNRGFVTLLEGGAAGDSVVVMGQGRLADGARVAVEETAP